MDTKKEPSELEEDLSGRELADKKMLDTLLRTMNLKGSLDRFRFPFGDSLRTNSNQYIFSAINTFDTSFVLMIERRPEIIKAIYYETIPDYHFNTPYIDDEINLAYFDGFSFKMDTQQWNLIIKESNNLLARKDSLRIVRQVDGSYYILSHNSKIKLCCDPFNPNLENSFKELQNLIRIRLMRDIYRRKADIFERAEKAMKN